MNEQEMKRVVFYKKQREMFAVHERNALKRCEQKQGNGMFAQTKGEKRDNAQYIFKISYKCD